MENGEWGLDSKLLSCLLENGKWKIENGERNIEQMNHCIKRGRQGIMKSCLGSFNGEDTDN